MNTKYDFLFALPLLIFAFSMGFGVNMKKWYGWVQVLSGFLSGLLIGENRIEKMVFGVILATMTLSVGSIIWRRRHPQ
jgi:hypothetical protein